MSRKKTTEEFIRQARDVHGDKYDYSKTEYADAFTKVCIICPKHGEFPQSPHDHLKGCGCNRCRAENVGNRRRLNTDVFIERAKKIHNNKYDYSKTNYVDSHIRVCIICPKHGEFWMMPYAHLNGQGCKRCKMSHLETEINKLLLDNHFNFRYDVRDLKFLNGLTLDFYIDDLKIGIECQGIQHFMDSRQRKCEKVIERDKIKRKLCEENGVKILYYSNLDIEYPYTVITDKNNLLNIIKNYANN